MRLVQDDPLTGFPETLRPSASGFFACAASFTCPLPCGLVHRWTPFVAESRISEQKIRSMRSPGVRGIFNSPGDYLHKMRQTGSSWNPNHEFLRLWSLVALFLCAPSSVWCSSSMHWPCLRSWVQIIGRWGVNDLRRFNTSEDFNSPGDLNSLPTADMQAFLKPY